MKNNFATNLKFLRKSKNLSQKELANKVNLTRQTISNYEKNLRQPDLFALTKISDFFSISIDELVFSKSSIELEELNTFKKIDSILNKNYNIYTSTTLLNTLNNQKIVLENNINLLNNELIEINLIIKYLNKKKSNFNLKNSNITEEFSEELTPLNIINFNEYKNNNSIDIDFYKNNNLKICDSLNSNFAYSNQEQLEYISVYGNISCGALKYTNGSIEDYFYLHKNDLKYDKSDYFILQIDGESMNKLYKNGDYILIHKTKNYEGYKPYVFILGDDATLKYIDIDLENQSIILIPHSTNSSYQKQILKFEDLNSTNFGILGTVEGVLNFID